MKNTGVYRVTHLHWVCPYCDKFHEELDLGDVDHGAADLKCRGCRETSRGILQGDTNEWKQIVSSKGGVYEKAHN